ncbi:MAG: alpha/beta hydrolase [Lachnospiraceae bacterium]|nr:alpha/beta hydrolase [Lachnospiraceae bacterium]MBP5184369.1 alpha/beta hydrolase [Lachnospiraceae bacterium]
MKVFFAVVMVLLVVFLALCTVVAYYLYRMAITRKGIKGGEEQLNEMQKKQLGMIDEARQWLETQATKDVGIISHDGLKLHAKFLPAENAVRTVICAHGFRVTALKDFGPMLRYYHENRTNVLMITERSHGASEGKYLCYGVMERFDIAGWAELINSSLVPEHLPIYLHGVSMGCATVVMASDIKLPGNVAGVIADCGFTSAWDEFAYIMKKNFKLPTFPVLNIADLICELTAGFEMGEVSTLDIMTRERYPMLFIHGANDDFVPTYMGVANYEKCVSKKKLVLFEGAGHALSWTVDLDLYERSVAEFFEECERK